MIHSRSNINAKNHAFLNSAFWRDCTHCVATKHLALCLAVTIAIWIKKNIQGNVPILFYSFFSFFPFFMNFFDFFLAWSVDRIGWSADIRLPIYRPIRSDQFSKIADLLGSADHQKGVIGPSLLSTVYIVLEYRVLFHNRNQNIAETKFG